jgi:hypothetical protein
VGALGAVVYDRATGEPLLLGAHHVLCDLHADGRVWQPAPCGEAGCQCNVVGQTLRGRRSIVRWRDEYFYVDAAVARIEPDVEFERTRSNTAAPAKGMFVKKFGPGTGMTEGVIASAQHVDHVKFGPFALDVPNQLRICPIKPSSRFAGDGDSGSLVWDQAGRVVGLLWGADGSGQGIASPIGPISEELGIMFQEGGQ